MVSRGRDTIRQHLNAIGQTTAREWKPLAIGISIGAALLKTNAAAGLTNLI